MTTSEYKNRYGDIIKFTDNEDGTITMEGGQYLRFGGREGQEQMDYNDLGFVDPSGGPFVEIGYNIAGKKVTRIAIIEDEKITLFVE